MGKFIALVIAAGVGAIVGRHVQPSELSVGLAAVLLIVVFAVVRSWHARRRRRKA